MIRAAVVSRDSRRRSFILDELGYLPFAQTGSQLLFHLISRLYERTFHLGRDLSLFTTEGFISTEAAQAYARARELSERVGDASQLVLADYGL